MTAYFRKQTLLLTLLGAAAGLAAGWLTAGAPSLRLALYVLPGGAVGWCLANWLAGKRIGKLDRLLFRQAEPEKFLEAFTPILEGTPRNTPAYVNGCNKLAYAWEALGALDRARSLLDPLTPDPKKRGFLGPAVTTCSNRIRVLLLQEQQEEAREALETLKALTEPLKADAPLRKDANMCIRLYEIWLKVLAGESTDEDFLRDEIDLARNRIRKSEIQLLLARSLANGGETEEADELLLEVLSTGQGLWAGDRARTLLGAAR